MADFALDQGGLGYDADFSRKANGRRDLRIVRGRASIAQRLQMGLRCFLGECRYDRLAGTPWTQVLFVHGMTVTGFRTVLESVMLRRRGVAQVLSMTLSLAPSARRITGSAQVLGVLDPVALTVPIELRGVLP